MAKKELFIFDMDGVLLDSEPFWRKAQITALKQLGHVITVNDCIANTMGKRLDDIAKTWINMFSLNVNIEKLSQSILDGVVHYIGKEGKAKDGLYTLIEFLRSKNCRIALATSSSTPIISAVINKLNLNGTFELMLSADEVEKGKPAPDIYLEVCRRLNVPTTSALALEDSLTGVRAAVAANITTIAIPEFKTEEFIIADYIVKKMGEIIEITEDCF